MPHGSLFDGTVIARNGLTISDGARKLRLARALEDGMMLCHTVEDPAVPKTKIAITLDSELIEALDASIAGGQFTNRSQAIEAAVAEQVARLARTRLAREAAKLDPAAEGAFADEGLAADVASWPEY
jgi:Arc/MetJ-type ribon-helix-helix transcriptional regulator